MPVANSRADAKETSEPFVTLSSETKFLTKRTVGDIVSTTANYFDIIVVV